MKKGDIKLTPNQQEYSDQLKRIRAALTRLRNQEHYNIPVELLPEKIQTKDIPKRVTKSDIKELQDIKPRHLKELALNKDVPFEYREMVTEVIDLTTPEAIEEFWNDFDISTPTVKQNTLEINTLPDPPKKSQYYYDEVNNVLLDRETGEVISEIIPTQAIEVIMNLIENLINSPNAEVSDYILNVLNQKITSDGMEKTAKKIIDFSDDVLDLAMEMHDYTSPEQLINTATELLDILDAEHSFDHRSAIASHAYNDISNTSKHLSSLNTLPSRKRR